MSVLDRKPGAVAWASLVGLSITASITPALGAEGSAGDAGAAGPSLEEVVVTAQKREERLQDVPVAISAVGAEALEANRVTDLYTLAASVPWVNMTQDSAVSQQLNIRGIVSVKLNDASAEPSVGLFVDEVYVSRMGSAFTDFFDLDRIEVIRGPQGVLLGKNVVGGALSVITAKPSYTPGGAATVSYGNHDSFMTNGHLTGGLSENVAARFAFQVRDRSGYNRNVLLNRDLDDLQSYQARAQLQFGHPDDDLRALLSVEYGNDESNGTIRSAIDDPAIAGIGSLGAFRAANGLSPREDMSPQAEYVKRRSIGASFRVDWDGIQNATLTSISAYRDSRARVGLQPDRLRQLRRRSSTRSCSRPRHRRPSARSCGSHPTRIPRSNGWWARTTRTTTSTVRTSTTRMRRRSPCSAATASTTPRRRSRRPQLSVSSVTLPERLESDRRRALPERRQIRHERRHLSR